MTKMNIKSTRAHFALHCAFYIMAFILWTSPGLYAQSSADPLASLVQQLPAPNTAEEQRLFKELIGMGAAPLERLMSAVQPNGTESGVKARYAVALLSHTVVDEQQKRMLEGVYLKALVQAKDTEVKAYFITQLNLVGSDASVATLQGFLADKDLFDPAIGALSEIGSENAKKGLLQAVGTTQPAQARVVKALGDLQYQSAAAVIQPLASSNDVALRKQALWALANIGDPASSAALVAQAQQVGFKPDPAEATAALVQYMHQLTIKKHNTQAADIAHKILASANDPTQKHLRLAAIGTLIRVDTDKTIKTVVAESKRFDNEYQDEVLKLAAPTVASGAKAWNKEYKTAKGEHQANLLAMLATANHANQISFADGSVVPALKATSQETRAAAAELLTQTKDKKYIAPLLDYLMASSDTKDLDAATTAIGQLAGKDDGSAIAQRLATAGDRQKIRLIQLLAAKRATNQFGDVKALTASPVDSVKAAAFEALPNVSSSAHVGELLSMLTTASADAQVKSVQSALITSVDATTAPQVLAAYDDNPLKLTPVLPYTPDKNAMTKVLAAFANGDAREKQAAFDALTAWPDDAAVRPLLNILKNPALGSYHNAAGESILSRVGKSSLPDDQKLLIVREVMQHASDQKQQAAALRAAGNIKTFLSLMFVSDYLDNHALGSAASRSAMQIALPASDGRPGLTGVAVRNVLNKMADKLTGGDSQYERIDILTYLEKMPHTIGYESIFNRKDLSGWQGLVEDPIKRSKITPAVLAKKQVEANAKVSNNWSVKDGMIVFQGDGANLCTIRKYGDFEMLVDWKISRNGDSGIYLRGSPQVQIWDSTRRDVGAQVGSGGLYNNQKEKSTPLMVADNPIGEWNTFRIRMVGERVWVHLNGILVVDSVTLENYWDRNLPIFSEEAIELQAHGTDLAFRNIYVKELNVPPYQVSADEAKIGFTPLFNGKDLDNWVGNKTDYVVEGNTIAIYPGEKSHGNLYSANEYGDFVFRFEFQLTPGANNGLGIHAPLEGDAAYVGKELQILDNTSPQYATLQPWQYHGSVYGILAAKRDFLKPVGEWNEQEVYVKGDYVRVTLNGTVIVEGDLKKATVNGTADHKDHPGLQRHKGHLGFLGHGSVVRFRKLRIRELK